MIARAKNAWAALLFALSSQCHTKVELDEAGQHKLERHLKIWAENGGDLNDEAEVESCRNEVAWIQQLEELLSDSEIEATEIVRLSQENSWKRSICEWRIFIIWLCCCIVVSAIATIILWVLGHNNWIGVPVAWLLMSLLQLAITLDQTKKDKEFERVYLKSLIAFKAGDVEKSDVIWRDYHAKQNELIP